MSRVCRPLRVTSIDAHVDGKPYGVDLIVPDKVEGKGQEWSDEQVLGALPAEHKAFTDWWASDVLQPGETRSYHGNYGGVDDVQLRVFRSAEDARENSVFKAIEVDAENPAWSSPWLSVSYQSKYYSVGTQHYYVSPIAGAHFTGKRHGDTSHYKQFELTMTKGWS